MAKYELKTKQNDMDVKTFLASVEHPVRREDGHVLYDMMGEITGETPRMWGDSLVGYGTYHYKSSSGQEGDWPLIGFSPRKANLSLYVLNAYGEPEPLLEKLGKHKKGVGCLYINKLADVDLEVLRQLIKNAWERE